MHITYCINNDRIELYPSPFEKGPVVTAALGINLKKCDYPLSVIHISGKINERSEINYKPIEEGTGLLVCIQFIKNVYMTEFNTSSCMEMDFCDNIIDIRLIAASIPFKFSYIKGGILRRIDIYFPEANVSELLSRSSVSMLEKNGHFVMERMEIKSISKKIQAILKESDQHHEKEAICCQAVKLIQLIKKVV
jgi:hypothetical protein